MVAVGDKVVTKSGREGFVIDTHPDPEIFCVADRAHTDWEHISHLTVLEKAMYTPVTQIKLGDMVCPYTDINRDVVNMLGTVIGITPNGRVAHVGFEDGKSHSYLLSELQVVKKAVYHGV